MHGTGDLFASALTAAIYTGRTTRDHECSGGSGLTARHNPAAYNGYPAYGPDGSQITSEAADARSAAMNACDTFSDVKTTGDLFASALTAAIYTGRTTREAVDFAGDLVRDAMRITREQPDVEMRGVSYLFASALTAAIYTGRTTREAVDFAGDLVRDAMRITREQPDVEMRGVSFEPTLGKVAALLA